MAQGRTSFAGSPTVPRETSSVSIRRFRGPHFAMRWRNSRLTCVPVGCSSCARPRIQTADRKEATRVYYRPYYRRRAPMKKLPSRADLRAILIMEAAGIEDERKGAKSSTQTRPCRIPFGNSSRPRPASFHRVPGRPTDRSALTAT